MIKIYLKLMGFVIVFSQLLIATHTMENISDEEPLAYRTGFNGADKSVWMELEEAIEADGTNFLKSFTQPYSPSDVNLARGVYVEPIELSGLNLFGPKEMYDQEQLNSCTANAFAWVVKYLTLMNSLNPTQLENNPEVLRISRLYQYYITREYESSFHISYDDFFDKGRTLDSGGSCAGAILAADKYGCCPENVIIKGEKVEREEISGRFVYKAMPYKIKRFHITPSSESSRIAYEYSKTGLNNGTVFQQEQDVNGKDDINLYAQISKNLMYTDLVKPFRDSGNHSEDTSEEDRIQYTYDLIQHIRKGEPIFAGTMLDKTFGKDPLGYCRTPVFDKHFKASGGHAFVVVGYGSYKRDEPMERWFKVANSWGGKFGDKGYLYLHETFFGNLKRFGNESFGVSLPKLGSLRDSS